MKDFTADFESPEMDEELLKFFTQQKAATPGSLARTLKFNRRFREHFCEWLKSIREPSWSLQKQKGDDGNG